MITIHKHSGIYTLEATQELSISIEEAWRFFSNPNNLKNITPSFMGFEITSTVTSKIYAGQIIAYKISPFFGIKIHWVSEITQLKEKAFFVDEQRSGPYKIWHHEHSFETLHNGNTLMKDKVSYKIPWGIFGNMMHSIIIKKQLQKIFEFRYNTLNEWFSER